MAKQFDVRPDDTDVSPKRQSSVRRERISDSSVISTPSRHDSNACMNDKRPQLQVRHKVVTIVLYMQFALPLYLDILLRFRLNSGVTVKERRIMP